ncbi:hypothetical protein DPMN_050259 [Dreissena polymorpha]|uniref:Uncharacterized protein n=1 Tax=Dreissena polymorpha TaxID=45954 RepID=A0A9D4CGE4_DREPO|nr:hypothetical protein DPMN_050259 [Dreissena polymorpha]
MMAKPVPPRDDWICMLLSIFLICLPLMQRLMNGLRLLHSQFVNSLAEDTANQTCGSRHADDMLRMGRSMNSLERPLMLHNRSSFQYHGYERCDRRISDDVRLYFGIRNGRNGNGDGKMFYG